jgi:hypothetical protein
LNRGTEQRSLRTLPAFGIGGDRGRFADKGGEGFDFVAEAIDA